MPTPLVVHVFLPSPLRKQFDYLPPAGTDSALLQPGMRLKVPFGKRSLTAMIDAVDTHSDCPVDKLRPAECLLDDQPLLEKQDLDLLRWAAGYYQHAPGDVVMSSLPAPLRKGEAPEPQSLPVWELTEDGKALDPTSLKRAPRQQALLQRLADGPCDQAALADMPGDWRSVLRKLMDKGLVASRLEKVALPQGGQQPEGHELNSGQQQALADIRAAGDGFHPFLLHGVTGSGKTEVYLQLIQPVLEQGKQVLVLVPEIGLTPQTLRRFRERFRQPVLPLHSGLSDSERLQAWLAARNGECGILIGTRSAVFTPLPQLGMIIVDEEHDASFKQQDGFRYSARDIAVWRARQRDIPIILGSATPSLESLNNVREKRYGYIHLPERAGAGQHPEMQLLDIRSRPVTDGLSDPLLQILDEHMQRGEQAILFLNRRGFAPVLICHECGWLSTCPRCDARMTIHERIGKLRCHHCGHERRPEPACPDCGNTDLKPLGEGTERIEKALKARYPDLGIARVDRDTTRARGSMEAIMDQVHEGEIRILVGTQMLTKGHDFAGITLVAIVDADQGLFGTDYRAPERMAQLIVQVAGRAGRAGNPGKVVIQTHYPDHPLLQTLITRGYSQFSSEALDERELAGLPPYSSQALLRAEAGQAETSRDFLQQARDMAGQMGIPGIAVMGPVPAPMERRAGRYRAQLLLQAGDRAPLQNLLSRWLPALEALPAGRKVRWSIDVDPQDMY